MLAAARLSRVASFRSGPALALALSCIVPAAEASAQFFADAFVEYQWHSAQMGTTVSNVNADILCSIPWSSDRTASGEPLWLHESLEHANGGCMSIRLDRDADYAVETSPTGVSISSRSSIGAVAEFEINWYGRASGAMTHAQTLRVRVLTWIQADLLVRFIADQPRDSAITHLNAQFCGPMDPLTGQPAWISADYAGSARRVENRPDTVLPPGVYELRVEGSGEFLDVVSRYLTAATLASASISGAHAFSPPPELDLDQDGWVGLSDACLWATQPTDANLDGQTNRTDLELILALARAAGEDATDVDGDGQADQCRCPADWNADGAANFFDVLGFLSDFSTQAPLADLNGDGAHNFFDVLEFLSAFARGC